LNVVTGSIDNPVTQTEILQKNELIERIANKAVTDDHSIHMVTRIDLNVANGINRAIKELMATEIVLGWNWQTTTAQNIFGGILENVLPKNSQMIYVVKVLQPFGYYNRLVVIVPQNAQYEPGYHKWISQIMSISKEITAKVLVFANGDTLGQLKTDLKIRNVSISFVEFNDFSNLTSLQVHLSNTDLLIWISARNSTISFNSYLAVLPRQLSKNFKKNSFVIIYPEQHSVLHQNSNLRLDGLTSSPIRENIERISKIGKEVKKVITGKSKR
jgi:hypothetical protein